MKAVVFHAVGDISLDEVPDLKILEPSDAVVKLTASAIRGAEDGQLQPPLLHP